MKGWSGIILEVLLTQLIMLTIACLVALVGLWKIETETILLCLVVPVLIQIFAKSARRA